MLIEKGELTSGSTWHAAGQCPSFIANYNLAKVHAYSNDLYARPRGRDRRGDRLARDRRHPLRHEPARARLLQAGRGRRRQHRLPDAGHQPRGDPADQPVRHHRGRAGRRVDAGRRLRGPVERLQRDGQGRRRGWARRSCGTTACWASSSCRRASSGSRPSRATSPASTWSTRRAATRTACSAWLGVRPGSPT